MHPLISTRFAAGIIATLAAGCAHAQDRPASAPAQPAESGPVGVAVSASRPADSRPADAAAADPKVDEVLSRMERRKLPAVQTNVSWKVEWVLDEEDEAVTKLGTLWYAEGAPTAKFLVKLHKRIVGRAQSDLDEQYLFDGRWLVELQAASSPGVVTRRELQPEGAAGNPFKFGEGPFPVPFGQSKADILREFHVSLAPPAKDDPPGTDHLRMIARANTRIGQDYRSVDLWIVRDDPNLSGLPIQVKAAKLDGSGQLNSIITVRFTDPNLRPNVPATLFRIDTPPGFQEIVERLGEAPPETP